MYNAVRDGGHPWNIPIYMSLKYYFHLIDKRSTHAREKTHIIGLSVFTVSFSTIKLCRNFRFIVIFHRHVRNRCKKVHFRSSLIIDHSLPLHAPASSCPIGTRPVINNCYANSAVTWITQHIIHRVYSQIISRKASVFSFVLLLVGSPSRSGKAPWSSQYRKIILCITVFCVPCD